MWTDKTRKAGSKKRASNYRERLKNVPPKLCERCGKIIPKTLETLSTYSRRRFCSKSCARRRGNASTAICRNCGKEFERPMSEKLGRHVRRRLCDPCWDMNKGIKGHAREYTVEELLRYYKGNHRLLQARIRMNAILVRKRDKVTECEVPDCNYSKHVQVCHIRAVASFSGSTMLGEINARENIVYLCPNHHWEFDHGQLCFAPKTWKGEHAINVRNIKKTKARKK